MRCEPVYKWIFLKFLPQFNAAGKPGNQKTPISNYRDMNHTYPRPF